MKRGITLAALAALLFGVTAPLLKRASADVGSLLSGAFMYLGAALGAGLVVALRSRDRAPGALPKGARARLLLVAALGGALAPALFVAGLRRVDGATASLLLSLEAPFTIALARVFLRERVGSRVLLAALLIFGGGAALVGGSVGSGVTLPGVLLVVAATLAWALDNLLARPLADHDPLDIVTRKGLLGAALAATVALAAREAPPTAARAAALMALGAVGYGASLVLYLRAQHLVGAARTASIFATAPFVGAVVAFVLGAPWPGAQLPVAAALIAAGVALHVSERHAHRHTHEAIEHDHMHRHDDGHHDHRHDPMPAGAHSHPHHHDALTHEHDHGEDLHHRHRH